jgi:putative ABC transport system permease protein
MGSVIQEVRFAVRSLRRQPLVSTVVVMTLALGLGANAATFGMVDALLLRPFTIPTVDRLIVLAETSPDDPFPQESVAPGNYLDLRAERGAVARMTTVSWWDVNLSGTDQPERAQGSNVGAEFFTIMGMAPAAGRFFQADDERPGAAKTVVISDGLWKRRFAAAPDVIGQTLRLDGEVYTIVGRAPEGFAFPNGSDLWAPLILDQEDATNRRSRYLTVVAELAPGATVESARAQLTAAYARLKDAHPEANRNYTLSVFAFTTAMVDYGLPRILALWQAAALLLLLIGGANIANLLIARGAERQRELAVRLAIGAGRGRIVRQLVVESIVLALVAIPAALLVAWLALGLIKGMMPAALIRFVAGWLTMGISPRVILVTSLAAFGTALLFGLLPALQSSRPSLTNVLKDGGRSSSAGVSRSRLRRGLVVVEIALALPLLLTAGLAALGSHRIANGPQGYEPAGVVRFRAALPETTYPDAAARRQFVARLIEEASATPGVTGVATTTVGPAMPANMRRPLTVDGREPGPEGPRLVNYRAISPAYLDVMRIPLVRGRLFTDADRDESERVAIVTESLARQYWSDESALGRRVKIAADGAWITIVGIASDTMDDWFNSRRVPTIYVPVAQFPSSQVTLVARASADTDSVIAGLRAALARVDSSQPSYDARTMDDAIYERTTGLRFISQLMTVFGGLALLLAAAGIYSVMAHYVAQRRHEIGVRVALGATPRDVFTLTVGQGLRLASMGIALGLLIGVGLARLMESALFGVVAVEPSLFAGITLLLALVALAATLLPARQAVSVDASAMLRD